MTMIIDYNNVSLRGLCIKLILSEERTVIRQGYRGLESLNPDFLYNISKT